MATTGKFLLQGSITLDIQPSGDVPKSVTINGNSASNLAIKFSISRKALSVTQTAQFRLYGLSESSRNAIFKDRFDLTTFRRVQFFAGYQGFNQTKVFDGTILQAYSDREGTTDTVTVIDAYDGGFLMSNGYVSTSIPAGTRADAVIKAFGSPLSVSNPNGIPGAQGDPIVGNFPQTTMRTEIFSGNQWEAILEKSGGNAAVENGIIKALGLNEAVSSSLIPLVSSATGLIGVPRRSGTLVEFDMVFEPNLNLFGLVKLLSAFNKNFNGLHRTMGYEHRGCISTAVAEPNVSTGSFIWFGNGTQPSAIAGIINSTP